GRAGPPASSATPERMSQRMGTPFPRRLRNRPAPRDRFSRRPPRDRTSPGSGSAGWRRCPQDCPSATKSAGFVCSQGDGGASWRRRRAGGGGATRNFPVRFTFFSLFSCTLAPYLRLYPVTANQRHNLASIYVGV